MKKERKMRADDDRKPLGEVPVPGMRAVEICHAVEDVKLQEVELNQGPLTKTKKGSTLIFDLTGSSRSPKNSFVWKFYLFIENAVDQS